MKNLIKNENKTVGIISLVNFLLGMNNYEKLKKNLAIIIFQFPFLKTFTTALPNPAINPALSSCLNPKFLLKHIPNKCP